MGLIFTVITSITLNEQEVGQRTVVNEVDGDIRKETPNDNCYQKLSSLVLLPLPTELADGLRLEGVSLDVRFAPMIGSSASNLALKSPNDQLELN